MNQCANPKLGHRILKIITTHMAHRKNMPDRLPPILERKATSIQAVPAAHLGNEPRPHGGVRSIRQVSSTSPSEELLAIRRGANCSPVAHYANIEWDLSITVVTSTCLYSGKDATMSSMTCVCPPVG